MTFGEDRGHAILVFKASKYFRTFFALEPSYIRDRLIVLIGQVPAEHLRETMAGGTLEPDIKKIRQFGVHNIVVVGRVHDDRIDTTLFDRIKAVA